MVVGQLPHRLLPTAALAVALLLAAPALHALPVPDLRDDDASGVGGSFYWESPEDRVLWLVGEGSWTVGTDPATQRATFAMSSGGHGDRPTFHTTVGGWDTNKDEQVVLPTFVTDETVTVADDSSVRLHAFVDYASPNILLGCPVAAQVFDADGVPLDPDRSIVFLDGGGAGLGGPYEQVVFPFDLAPGTYHGLKVQFGPDALDCGAPAEWAWGSDDQPARLVVTGSIQTDDRDSDGVPDEDDAFPDDPTEWRDSDSDGVGDNRDAFPDDPTEWRDSDDDGVGDNRDACEGSDDGLDADGDGVPDGCDDAPVGNVTITAPGDGARIDGHGDLTVTGTYVAPAELGPAAASHVVVAVIDSGINPYHEEFRDPARTDDPATYLSGYPEGAARVELCFAASSCPPSTAAAEAADAQQWGKLAVTPTGETGPGDGLLGYFPGTKVVGAVSFGHDGDPGYPVLDGARGAGDAHGTQVAGALAGDRFGTCPDCLLVVVEADGVAAIEAAYEWAANQPYIDLITSSVSIGLAGTDWNPGLFAAQHEGAKQAVQNGKVVFEAAGNGAANLGLVPTTTLLLNSGSPYSIAVGSSEKETGSSDLYHDFPVEITATGRERDTVAADSFTATTRLTGTSFASPSAAGVAGQALLRLRDAYGDTTEGAADGSLLRADEPPLTGPFANGRLTSQEFREAVTKTAAAPRTGQMPVSLEAQPDTPAGFVREGYGEVNWLLPGGTYAESTRAQAVYDVVSGAVSMPARMVEEYYLEEVIRPVQEAQWLDFEPHDDDGDGYPTDAYPQTTAWWSEAEADLDPVARDLFASAALMGPEAALGSLAQAQAREAKDDGIVPGALGEVRGIMVGEEGDALTLELFVGSHDDVAPTLLGNPVSYEARFTTHHNVGLTYRVEYRHEVLQTDEATPTGRLVQKTFELTAMSRADNGLRDHCPVMADLSGSDARFDDASGTYSIRWVVPFETLVHTNVPPQGDCAQLLGGGEPLGRGDTVTDVRGVAVLRAGTVNVDSFRDEATAGPYTVVGTDPPEPAPCTDGGHVLVTLAARSACAVLDTTLGGAWSVTLPELDLAPGRYDLTATVRDGDTDLATQTVSVEVPVPDRDGDGVPDDEDAFPDDPTEWADADGDGVGDNGDACHGFDDRRDADGDGLPDACDDDMDGDGRPNHRDADRDGDGHPNGKELAHGTDPDDPASHPRPGAKQTADKSVSPAA